MNVDRPFGTGVTFPFLFIFSVTLFRAEWLSGLRHGKQIRRFSVPTPPRIWHGR